MQEFRLLGLDYGQVTVGVAGSDDLFLTAQGLTVIRRKQENKLRQTFQQLEALISERNINALVVGYPKLLDNSVGERAKKSEEFAEMLHRRTGLPVILWDERLTTVSAHRVLDEANMHYEKKARVVDRIAATFILQSYMDMINASEAKKTELREIILSNGNNNPVCD